MTIGGVSCGPVTISNSPSSGWVQIVDGPVPLRCWWQPANREKHDFESKTSASRVYIVLPEVFGVNGWVRSIAARLAGHGVPALAVPLFARTAPALDLEYSPDDLAEGRRHKDVTTTPQILSDLAAAITWVQRQCPGVEIAVVGFCFGGHAALLAASLPGVSCAFDFYGAGVSRMRPGGGAPSLELLSQVKGQLVCLCGTADPLIPAEERAAIRAALLAQDPATERLRYVELEGADHGFMCEARSSFDAVASAEGWRLLLEGVRA